MTNQYLEKNESFLFYRYSDAVLENYHCAEFFTALGKTSEVDIFANLSPAYKKSFRSDICELILATCLSNSKTYLNKFTKVFLLQDATDDVLVDSDSTLLLMQLCLKAADVAHPAKNERYHQTWTNMIMAEFYRQGKKEKEAGLAVSPFMAPPKSRDDESMGVFQFGFIKYVALPIFKAWQSVSKFKLTDVPERCFHRHIEHDPDIYLNNLDHNSDYWLHLFEVEYGLEDEFFKATHEKNFASLVLGNSRKERLQAIQKEGNDFRSRTASTTGAQVVKVTPTHPPVSSTEQSRDVENPPLAPAEQSRDVENP